MGDLYVNHYRVIYADPPWLYRSNSEEKPDRNARRHYPTMDFRKIAALPVAELAARDCHLFLWTTGPNLQQAFEVMRGWGFRFSSMGFVWIKLKRSHDDRQLRVLPIGATDLHTGLGFTTRKNAEFCLLGRRGSPKRIAKNIHEIILSPVREHSRKPDEACARIERYADGPRLELFARQARPGWDCWGNEPDKFG